MPLIVREQNYDRPSRLIPDTDRAVSRDVRKAAREQLKQRVLDLLADLIELFTDQERDDLAVSRVFIGRERFAQFQELTRPSARASLFKAAARGDRLPNPLRLRLPIPVIEHIGERQSLHPL